MLHKDTKISVLGDGGWGTTLTVLLAKKGFSPFLWGAFPQYTEEVRQKRENVKFLPGIHIPEPVKLTSSLKDAMGSELIVLAVPTQYLRSIVAKLKKYSLTGKVFAIVSKGVETASLCTPSQIVHSELGAVRLVVISGPNIAREVALEMPAAAVVASSSTASAAKVRQAFTTDYFTLFESSDVLGVELGASVKNVIAICAGIVEGMGLGSNTRALLFARGVAEMARLGQKMGAKRETFMGLSGLGDLATTCLSPHSRNRSFGFEIGKGRRAKDILSESEMVVEGVETSKAVHRLSKKYGVSMPISEAVYKILFNGEKPETVVNALLHKGLVRERD